MDTNIIVYLSDDDDPESEMARKKLNRKRWSELKKYIVFLEYIALHDPVKNANYVKLLQWIRTENEFSAQIANNCESRIKLRYEKLKSTMAFPPHIVAVFSEIDAIVISDEDEDPSSLRDDINPHLSDLLNLEENKSRFKVKNNTTAREKRKIIQKEEKIKDCIVSLERNCSITTLVKSCSSAKESSSIKASKVKCDQNKKQISIDANSPLRAASEEGEILSDDGSSMEILKNESKKSARRISLSKIVKTNKLETKGIESFYSKAEDDAINQELFERIDRLDEDTGDFRDSGLLSREDPKNKEVEHENSPIVRKNLNREMSRRTSKNILSLDTLLSPVSNDDEFNIVSHKKKKKKHKHKKKTCYTSDWCITESENHSEKDKTMKRTFFRRDIGTTNDNTICPEKQNKKSKKHKEKRRHNRALSISDDEEGVNPSKTAQSDLPKTPEAKLFNRRKSTRRENKMNIEKDSAVTVVLSDSDEEISQSSPSIVSKSGKTFFISTSPPSTPSSVSIPSGTISSSNVIEGSNQKKEISSNTNELRDINNMGLQELNDIYSKLCEKTGIQLEELLKDLMTKSKTDIDKSPSINQENFVNPSDFGPNILKNVSNNKRLVSNENDLNHELQQQENYQHQQEFHLQLQQDQGRQQPQQPLKIHCPTQIHCDLQVPFSYRNSLRPGLNLNDPRIVQKLKQIKDSPIHNISIRESASFLMNCYTSRPQNRSTSVVEVTSKTATIYGEHKRLRELENQKLLERENARYAIVKSNKKETPYIVPNQEQNMKNDSKLTKSKSKQKYSSGSESGRKAPTSIEKNIEKEEESATTNYSINPKARLRIESSSSSDDNVFENHTTSKENVSSGRITPYKKEKIVDIILSAVKDTRGNADVILESLANSLSKSRKNSSRHSTESASETLRSRSRSSSKSLRNSRQSTESTKSDAKSIKSKHELGETVQNNTDEIKNGKECGSLKYNIKKSVESIQSLCTEKKNKKQQDKKLAESSTKLKNSPRKRGSRELNNLNCTFKEYREIFEKNCLPTVEGKRRCSILAGASMNNKVGLNDSSNKKLEDDSLLRNKRDTSNNNDGARSSREEVKAAPIQRRRQTCSALPRKTLPEKNILPPLKVVIRRLSESGTFSVKGIDENSSDTDEFDIEEHRKVKINSNAFESQLRIKLRKLSLSEIKKSLTLSDKVQKNNYDPINSSNAIAEALKPKEYNVDPENHTKESIPSPEVALLVESTSKPVDSPSKRTTKPPRHFNIDINMTLKSTKACAICNKRPVDLTNHYVVQHKTESYISRLSNDEIKNLETNITLAVPYRKRFKVSCAFCQDELDDNFVNFHPHYSFHTGEYGFRCDVCDIVKPYREDIRSHQHRTSRCRNGKIRTNYLYSPDLMVIYLYVCKLCNFVQLNEANIHKHQRDHHGFRFDEPQHVKKCIIAAIDSGKVVNEVDVNLEGVKLKPANIPTSDPPVIQQDHEQEFVHECPLDIKDILLTQEIQASQCSKQNHEVESTAMDQCVLDNQSNTENQLVSQRIDRPDSIKAIKQESLTISSDLSSLHNLLDDINLDYLLNNSKTNPSPEALLEQLHAPPSDNIMTVIHCTKEAACHEKCQPNIEPDDRKPNIQDIPIEKFYDSVVDMKAHQIKPDMNYRQLKSDSTYFGLYKCMLEACWFSTNIAEKFIQHTSFHTSKNTKISLSCAYCTVKNACAQKLVRHVRSRHSMSRYQCSECSYRSMVPGNVRIHRRIYHKDSTADKCIIECASRLRSMDDKLIAMKRKMMDNVASLTCPGCSSAFFALSSIKLHIQQMHPLLTLDNTIFNEFACIYCKKESNSKNCMQIHLALEHPNEMGYVVERKLKGDSIGDAIENLNMIDISMAILPDDIHAAVFKESENLNCEDSKLEDKDVNMQPLSETNLSTENSKIVESRSNSQNKQERLVLERIKPLLELVASNFESRNFFSYICFHCVTSFYSREKICEHFATSHQDCPSFIEKAISFGTKSYCIVKKQDIPIFDWVPILQNFADEIRINWIDRLHQNLNFEWWEGLTSSCLEEIEIPQYLTNTQPRYKCLLRSCPFVALEENALDLHLMQHTVPRSYKCSHCALNLTTPSWEDIKNHKMLHKNNLHICCVCKFWHHNRSGITKHIDNMHNSRDVPVISLWRDETNYKTSLAIVLPPGKFGFTTSVACFCCRMEMKNSTKLIRHLRTEHNITLCLKCELCDKILLTQLEAETHTEEHGMQIFKLKYDVLATFLYNLTIKSLSPFTIEMRPTKEKRTHKDVEASTAKRTKLSEEPLVTVKEEVIIKTECDEDAVLEDATTLQMPGGSIKCVNIDQLVAREPAEKSCTQGITKRAISRPASNNVNVPQYQLQEGSQVAQNKTNLNNDHNGQLINSYPIGLIQDASVMQHSSPVLQPQKQALPGQVFISVPLPNYQGTAVISRALESYTVPTTWVPQIVQKQTHPGHYNVRTSSHTQHNGQPAVSAIVVRPNNNYSKALYLPQSTQSAVSTTAASTILTAQLRPGITHEMSNNPNTQQKVLTQVHYSQQNGQPTASITLTPPIVQPEIRPGINHSEANFLPQNAQSPLNLAVSQDNITEPFIPEIVPICENCKMECTDFSHLRSHFEAVHAPKNIRFLFRLTRRVECVHCSYRGSLRSLPAHYTTFHPDKQRFCRSLIDSNRCGACHEVFSVQLFSNSPMISICACPIRQRVLADCLDLKTLNIIQNFGKEFYAYLCVLCKRTFHYQREYAQHILNVHHRNDIIPGLWLVKHLFYMCNSCDKITMTIKEVIEHIRGSHLSSTATGSLADRMAHYNQIGIIYPKGLIVCISELRNTGSFDEESFKRDVQCVEAQYISCETK